MASIALAFLFLSTAFSLSFFSNAKETAPICPFNSIYQLGDSLADTGNRILIPGIPPTFHAGHLPYGETYFGKPTGRFSDGLLMIDYIAIALKLPLLNPYLSKNSSFIHGVNFAVAGSTALDKSFFDERNISIKSFNPPLSAQIEWFKNHLNCTCRSPTLCAKKLRKALVSIGAFGGNDYFTAFSNRKSIEEAKTLVPFTVNAIVEGIKEIIKLGVKRIVSSGVSPFGCLPSLLTSSPSSDPDAYDEFGCLRDYNKFASFHNNYLRDTISLVSRQYSDVVILYVDYYGAFLSVFRRAYYLGIDRESLLKACCGNGGKYNFDGKKTCGSNETSVCSDPSRFMNWDGVHLTQKAYRHISEILITDILSNIDCIW
ncbi:acetylajmalan esterase-like [Nicotiana tomentosiformis]|uniref:acetylajmalan esterase-like n=1 Tax=Nicotiana tomentosiformis TaxID=4098 RepID=UPI00051B9FAA|nr:acetylajmalan esterase-like [Nicotiana tomentosiformis]